MTSTSRDTSAAPAAEPTPTPTPTAGAGVGWSLDRYDTDVGSGTSGVAALHADLVDVVVAGGGIAGLATALALARIGRSVRVLEQRPDPGDTGAGLQLAPNATRILRHWGVLDDLIAHAVQPRRLVLRDAVDGAELTHVDVADVQRRYGAPYLLVRRSMLHAVLRRACEGAGVELVTATTVVDIDPPGGSGGGAVAVSARRRDPGHVVVAADGLRSRLRWPINQHTDRVRDTGYIAYRSLRPTHHHTTPTGRASGGTSGGRVSTEDMVIHIGPGRHLVQYPLDHGETINQVAVFHRDPAPHVDPDGRISTDPHPDELDDAFTDDHPDVRHAVGYIDRDRHWPVCDHDPLTRWTRGRLVLTGDAAHPTLQYLAQGACQAIEDAQSLATHTAAHLPVHGNDWDTTTLADYITERISRTTEIQYKARAWGELLHADGLLRDIRNALLRDRWAGDYRHLDWLWLR